MLLLLLINPVVSQRNIEMHAGKKLTPADFIGVPNEAVDYLAQTNPIISLTYSKPMNCKEKGKVKLNIETGVSVSERSWIKLSKIKTKEQLNALLSHEQGHYDMGAIFSIELKKTLSDICFDKGEYKQQVDAVFKSMYSRYDSLQREYDSDTDHMANKTKQIKWKEKITGMWKNVQ